jgi:hypothetical protein
VYGGLSPLGGVVGLWVEVLLLDMLAGSFVVVLWVAVGSREWVDADNRGLRMICVYCLYSERDR